MNTDLFILESASTMAPHVDKAMLALLFICGSALFVVFVLVIFFSIIYRKNSKHNRILQKQAHPVLEWAWTIGSLVIFIGLFVWGAIIYFKMHVLPTNTTEITVVGKQWMWKFQHPNGQREINELHVMVGQPILLTMISQDVIHSIFVPDFRMKQDVLPGRYTRVWFEATKIGEYRLYCTQYCGTMHADMIGRVIVLSEEDYKKWQQKEEPALKSRGAQFFAQLGCLSCHSETSKNLGPSLKGLFGSKVKLSTGEKILADENYIRESILNPNAKIVHAHEPLMPTYMGKVSEEDLLDIIAYIKSLTSLANTGES